jgi:hypothetical protein
VPYVGASIPHMPGRIIFADRKQLGWGEFMEMKVWKVDVSPEFPHGVKFSCACVREVDGRKQRVFSVDNAHGKGPHEHLLDRERPLPDADWARLLVYFEQRVASMREGAR